MRRNESGSDTAHAVIRGVNAPQYMLYEAVMSLVVGVVVMLACTVVVLGLDRTGILASVNSLLGSIAPFTVNRLITLSALFSLVVTASRIIIRLLWVLITNSALTMIGGLDLRFARPRLGASAARPVAHPIVAESDARPGHGDASGPRTISGTVSERRA